MPTQQWRKKYSDWVSKVSLEKLKASSSKALQTRQPMEVTGMCWYWSLMNCLGLHYRVHLYSRLCLNVQGNDWADLPAEVVEAVLDNLDEKDCWDCRLISSNWGSVVREYQSDLVIPVHPRTLWSQSMASSFRQRQAQYPRTRFTLKLARPFDFGELAELLSATVTKVWVCKSALVSERSCSDAAMLTRSIPKQLMCLSDLQNKLASCDLEVMLAIKETIPYAQELQVRKDVGIIATACTALKFQDVLVRIQLRTVLGYNLTLVVTKELAPFLHTINYHQVLHLKDELTQTSDFFTNPAGCFSSSAFKNLSSNDSPIQSLCLSDHSFPQLESSYSHMDHNISAIGALQHLTKLHLSMQTLPDFVPLAQLSGLKDLALQSGGFRTASACDVLRSNSPTLTHVLLCNCVRNSGIWDSDDYGWDSDTLRALDDLSKLQSFTIKVLSLTVKDARILSHLLRPQSIQIVLRRCARMSPEAFKVLSSSQASITHLELWELDRSGFCELQSVQSLCSLTVVRPSADITGEGLQNQPRLHTLRLVSCFALNDAGLQALILFAPMLNMLMIQQELQHKHLCPAELRDSDVLTKHGLMTVAQAPNLVYLDLQGVKITRGGEKMLENTIYAQQKSGNMQSAVAILLPKFSEQYGDQLFTPRNLHYPAFVPHPARRTNKISCSNGARVTI